jgi:hypothetical protein
MRAFALLFALSASLTALPQVARADDSIRVHVSYAKENRVASNIKNECKLVEQLRDFIVAGSGGKVTAAEGEPDRKRGSVLIVEITDSVSQGNAFMGHRKYTAITGKLYKGGAESANFDAARNSMGGAFAGYKGSCSVLGRTVKTLAADVNRWLQSPSKDASLGDM